MSKRNNKKDKLTRNSPCPCGAKKEDGSAKKYKFCCWDKDRSQKNIPHEIPPEVLKKFMDYHRNPEPFGQDGALVGRRPVGIALKDKESRIRAVGKTIYKRPIAESFHIFILNILADLLGRDWYAEQTRKPRNEWHPMFEWVVEFKLALQKNNDPTRKGQIESVVLTGGLRALLAIAYDVYSIQHCGSEILPKLINRLKNTATFQGARYEVAVGGIVARSGFKIEWFSETKKGKHCEFIGVHKITEEKVAFEAKSHHRDGILGKAGVFAPENARVKIFDHLREAIEQSPKDLPLVCFDDLNLPLSEKNDISEQKWFVDINVQLQHGKFFDQGNETQYAALIVTNFSWHFHGSLPKRENEVVSYFHEGKKFSLNPETIKFLIEGARQYGFVPEGLDELEDIGLKMSENNPSGFKESN